MDAFIVWIVFASMNMVAAVMTILTIATWKSLCTDTQFFAVYLMFCEIGLSLCSAGGAIYHLYNIYFKIPVVMLQSTCFRQIVLQYIFIFLILVFHAVLSFNHFVSAVFPLIYQKWSRYYSLIIVIIVWTVSCSITATLYGSVSDSLMIVQCLSKIYCRVNLFIQWNHY